MDPIDKIIDEKDNANAAKASTWASRIERRWEQFKNAAQKKTGLSGATCTSAEIFDTKDVVNDGIYRREYDNDDEDFSYHSSNGSDKDDSVYDLSLGASAEGTSPPATARNTDGQFPLGGQVEDLPDWLHEMNTNRVYNASHLLAAPITQIFPCISCKNHKDINNPTAWIPVFLWKLGKTTWEVFDKIFGEIGPELEWDSNDGHQSLWGMYYRCPDLAYIQQLQAARTATNSIPPTAMLRQAPPASFDKVSNECLAQDDAAATATTCSSTLPSFDLANPALSNAKDMSVQSALSKRNADLQAALDKHRDNILCLLQTKTPTSQNTIPPKMLLKIWAVTMITIVQINDSIARTGVKELSLLRLKELGGRAEHEARELYEAREDNKNSMDQVVVPAQTDAMTSNNQPPARVPQSLKEFWHSLLLDGYHILSMEPDGNFLFCSISDQLNHDNGYAHGHQITNHICRHSDEFKDFLLLQDDHEDISDLESYIYNMGQNGVWGGNPEVYAAAWFYGVNTTIYSQEYVNTDGILIIKADGPQGKMIMFVWCGICHIMVTTITTVSNHPEIPPSQFSI